MSEVSPGRGEIKPRDGEFNSVMTPCENERNNDNKRFIRTLNNKIYKYVTLISKKIYYIDKLGVIVNKYNNTYHSTIKMNPVDVKSSTFKL